MRRLNWCQFRERLTVFGNRNLFTGLLNPVHQLETSGFELRSRDQHNLTISLTGRDVKRTQLGEEVRSYRSSGVTGVQEEE